MFPSNLKKIPADGSGRKRRASSVQKRYELVVAPPLKKHVTAKEWFKNTSVDATNVIPEGTRRTRKLVSKS